MLIIPDVCFELVSDDTFADLFLDYFCLADSLNKGDDLSEEFIEIYGRFMYYIYDNRHRSYTDEVYWSNKIMHSMHNFYKAKTGNDDLRMLSVKHNGHYKVVEIIIDDIGVALGDFPSDLKSDIESVVKDVDGVAVIYTSTWLNYHGANGELILGYDYMESARIEIRYLDRADAKKAVDIIANCLKNHDFKVRWV
jgi:hypothetical protein